MSPKPKEITDDHIHSFAGYSALDIKPESFLLEPWLVSPSYNLLVAKRGLGKSWFSLAVGIAVASGTHVMQWEAPEPRKVLYIDGEMSPRQLQDRLKDMTGGLEHIDENLLIMSVPHLVRCGHEPPSFTLKAWRTQLELYISRHQDIALVIFDNVSCLFAGLDENDKKAWDEPNAFLVRLRSCGISTIVVHHTGKEGSKGQRGSSSREDHVDVSLRLSGVPGHDPSKGCKLVTHFSKARSVHGEAIAPMQMDLAHENGRLQFIEGEATLLQKEIMEEIGCGTSYRDVAKKLSCSVRYVNTTAKRYKDVGF